MNAKRKRKSLSLEQRIECLERLKFGCTYRELSQEMGIPESTIRNIKLQEKKINEATKIKKSKNDQLVKTKKLRGVTHPHVEERVYEWFVDHQNIADLKEELQKKAREIHRELCSKSDCKFVASTGWLKRFRDRHGLEEIKRKLKKRMKRKSSNLIAQLAKDIGCTCDGKGGCLFTDHSTMNSPSIDEDTLRHLEKVYESQEFSVLHDLNGRDFDALEGAPPNKRVFVLAIKYCKF